MRSMQKSKDKDRSGLVLGLREWEKPPLSRSGKEGL